VPWVACIGGNCLLAVDPEATELTEVALPDPATKVRRLAFDADGMPWARADRRRPGRA
jgi:hypothetical protein